MKGNLNLKTQKNHHTLIAIFIIAIGALVRLIYVNKIPLGLNQDEAFAAYEAFSILNYGVDSAGNHFPTYFVSWGSGMNVLESYLAIPFMWIFGYDEWVFRLPSVICAIASLPVFWLILRRFCNEKTALIGLGILTVSPWHVMLSRWGLESNLTPAFLLFGIYFLIKGISKNKFFVLSAIFFGFSLYAYSINWITVPLILIVFGVYILKIAPKIKIKFIIISCFILLIFALPHMLFLLINANIIPEIKTSFITIPKMLYMRSNELSILNIFNPQSWINLFKILFLQNDTIDNNALPYFGIFYHLSLPFFVVGFITLIKQLKIDIKSKKLSGAYFVLGGFSVYFITSLTLLNLNINKCNGMHIFTAFIIVFGVNGAINFVKNKKIALCAVIVSFALCFASFCGYYFTFGQNKIYDYFSGELNKAVELITTADCQKVAVDHRIFHSQIMYYDKTPQKEFEDTVKYEFTDSPYLKATSFGKYTFISEYNKLGNYDAYIFPLSHLYFFSEEDFYITVFEKYAVAMPK